MTFAEPGGWPDEVVPVFERFVTCEYASLTADGRPVTWPVTPYLGVDGRTVDVSTGLAYPAKAERARRDPRVALLFSDPTGSGLERPPVVLVRGLATVRDRDLQANTDRYVSGSMRKLPAAWRGAPRFAVRAQRWYWSRIWILVAPLAIEWWPAGESAAPPRRWEAPPDVEPEPSDPPPPPGRTPWRRPPSEWRYRAVEALQLGPPVLTTVGQDGFPLPVRALRAEIVPEGFSLDVPIGVPEPAGPACLTFHRHAERFVGQHNMAFVGEAFARPDGAVAFRVDRALADFSLPGGRLKRTLAFLSAGRALRERVGAEAARRGQPVPRVRFPR